MPQTFAVDQDKTFGAVAWLFLSCTPKQKFGTDEQDATKDGTPKWEVRLLASYRNQFGSEEDEVMKVGVASEKDPSGGMPKHTSVRVTDLEVGVMQPRNGEGKATVWYRLGAIEPEASSGVSKTNTSSSSSKSEAA